MALDALKRLLSGPRPVIAVVLLLLASLYLMSGATQNSAVFGQLYSILLGVNLLALMLLLLLIGRHLIRLLQQYRRRAPGSRLTVRLVVMFVVLAVAPVSVVYYFSVQFLQRGIDSWFDVRVEEALEDSLELGRTALDGRLRELLRQTRQLGTELTGTPEGMIPLTLNDVREKSDAAEMTLLTLKGRVLASSSANPSDLVPAMPPDAVLLQLRQGLDYARLEPVMESGLQVRVALVVADPGAGGDPWVLQAIYPVAERLNTLADSVQSAFAEYKELAYLRQPLKDSFTITLSLVLLLSLLSAVWAAFFSARRLVAPVRDLAEGTRAVAAGDYDKRLPPAGRDELGFLVRSFNEMTQKIAQARDAAQRSRQQAEKQRTYLEVVLGRLSSGVLTLDGDHTLRTLNTAATQILDVAPEQLIGAPLSRVGGEYTALQPFLEAIGPHLEEHQEEWRVEVTLFGSKGRQVLMCRGAPLPGVDERGGGHVIVFDDITTLVQAQRDAAWGEVARRLAHEIKNPLTPIQLSAERLRHKYLKQMPPGDAEVLDRSTRTIVQQVEAMKEMVKAFSDYARTPKMSLGPVDLNALVGDVLELYRGDTRKRHFQTRLDPDLPLIEADAARLRQVVHNLVKNALEAAPEGQPLELSVSTRCGREHDCGYVELEVSDNGPGIPSQLLGELFEPYVTSKPKGTGLGLAIVKKIVEEHGGMIWARNRAEGGAAVIARLPSRAGAEIDSRARGPDNADEANTQRTRTE